MNMSDTNGDAKAKKGPRRVLVFSFAYYPRFVGGAEVAVKEITDRIDEKDIEFDLIALRISSDLPRFERIGNVNVHRIGFSAKTSKSPDSLPWHLHLNKYLYPFLAASKAELLHKTKKYDAVWAIMANYSGFAALFFKLFHVSVPMILTLQEGDPIDYIKRQVRFVYPIWKLIFAKADLIQAISRYLGDFGRSMGASCPVEIVPNGVDLSRFTLCGTAFDRQKVRENLGFSPDDTVLVTTSRLVVKNAVGDVIRSLPHLPASVKFLIAGIGYQEEELKALARDLDVADRVRFLGFVDHKDMPPYLWASDIFIRPSLSEGLGNSFIEAMAAGLPVIATNVGGIPDFLSNKATGLFCGVSDPHDIANKVGIYMRDSALRAEIVDNARRMAIERYDWDRVARDMKEKVFDAAIDHTA